MPHFLQDLAVVLTVAAITTVLCHRFRIPVVVGYIVAGLATGAANPVRLISHPEAIETLSELGVVLIMYTIGLEFSFRRLARLAPVVGVAAAVEVGLMLGLGYLAGQLAGWSPRSSLFAAGIVAISSTMIVAKAFEERPPSRRLEDLVLGVLLMEDLVAILLLVLFSTEAGATGSGVVLLSVGRLIGFLALLVGGGMFLVPRAMRVVQRLDKAEITLVAGIGAPFLFAVLADLGGYSVALGGFVAGALVRESGTAHRVAEVVRPVRDLFAAIFFVAVGMLVDPRAALQAWPVVLALVVVVLVGKTIGVTVGGFLAGFGVRTSIRGGMTLAQIGEFSFVIAGLGLATGSAPSMLYPVAVTVSVITAMLTPGLMRISDPLSAAIDRRLPRRVQTFVTLYGSWVELLRRGTGKETVWRGIRRPLRWMLLDTAGIGGVVVAASLLQRRGMEFLRGAGFAERYLPSIVVLIALGLALPFAMGLLASARRVADRLGKAALPPATQGVDQGRAPRQLLTVVIQMAIVLVLGLPLIVVTQPFLSTWPVTLVVGGLLLLLTISFWHSAADLEGHARAGAELIVDILARQGVDKDEHSLEAVEDLLPGLGTIVVFQVDHGSAVVGRSLGDINLRGLTGVSIVALSRGSERIAFPGAAEVLHAGDVVALTGSQAALVAANRLLRGLPLAERGGLP